MLKIIQLSVIEEEKHHQDPMTLFLYALKAPESKRQYPRRFKMFLDYLNLKITIQEQAKQFLINARANPQWAQDKLMQFIAYQNQRVSLGEISPSTIPNYYRATKLFCEMHDITLSWKK
jgi:hypothetical protein